MPRIRSSEQGQPQPLGISEPLLAPPATQDIRADGSARLLAEQGAILCPDPARALTLL
ncbi:hypothetical protein [Streptomyces mirabilis]|uniref:hypothetical protein n=1 Tax=Streptomyces mirabilis TaxID=68239 RepID=UPI0036909A2E